MVGLRGHRGGNFFPFRQLAEQWTGMIRETSIVTNPVRIAIIGAGAVSDYHHVPGIRLDPRAELGGVCDADPRLLEQRRADWGCSRLTSDFEEICADPGIDAVIIATPNFTHHAIATTAARHGKHVMCEKPLGLNAAEVRQMYQAGRDAQVVHMTAFTYRFAPAMRYLKHLVESGALGEPVISAASDFWTCRKPVGDGGSTPRRRVPAICST
jgi:predicted dehydrogenase